jgi:hypothetical protein
MIMISTSFAVLAVSMVSYKEFNSDSKKVDYSIFLVGALADLCLSFRAAFLESDARASNSDIATFLYC